MAATFVSFSGPTFSITMNYYSNTGVKSSSVYAEGHWKQKYLMYSNKVEKNVSLSRPCE